MAKGKGSEVLEDTISAEDELVALRSQVARLEQEKKDAESNEGTYSKELESLRKGKSQGLNEIQVKEIAPKMVSLWHVSGHNVGKRVGPLHPDNAEETFLRFAFFKIKLSTKRPTDEWIAAYKETNEFKVATEAEIKRRAGKNKSRKASETERLIEAMARQQGITKDQVVNIKDQSEVKGRASR